MIIKIESGNISIQMTESDIKGLIKTSALIQEYSSGCPSFSSLVVLPENLFKDLWDMSEDDMIKTMKYWKLHNHFIEYKQMHSLLRIIVRDNKTKVKEFIRKNSDLGAYNLDLLELFAELFQKK